MKNFINSVMAGVLISISTTCFLLNDNKVIGAFLFSLGLITILVFKFNLYTGKVGYIIEEKKKYILSVLVVLIGNFIGVVASSYAIMNTRIYEDLLDKAQLYSLIKVGDSFASILILSIFCGLLMFVAVDNFKNAKDEKSKYLLVILCVMVFIIACFEHSIANMVYLMFGKILFTVDGLLFILICILGNAIGTMIIPLVRKIK